jgi:hypothetical protein
MVGIASGLFLLTGLVLASPEARGDDSPIARPEVREGDRWIYRRMDYAGRRSTGEYELRVTFAGPKAIVAVARDAAKGTETDTSWSSEWNAAVAANGDSYTPDSQTFRFPLAPGATWRSAFEMRRPHARGFTMLFDRTAKVAGWETLEVPAGRFRALRLDIEGGWKRGDVSASGRSRTTMWYAPEVKRWVKYEYRDEGTGSHFGEELVRFAPAP